MNIGVPTFSTIFEPGKKGEMVPSCVDTGVSIHLTERESLEQLKTVPINNLSKTMQAGLALYQTLGAYLSPADDNNISKGVLDPTPAAESLKICVGKKP